MRKKRRAEVDGAGWTSGFVGRLEVATDWSGRRQWSSEAKGRIARESLAPGATVSGVARRHGLMPQQVTARRRLTRLALPEAAETAAGDDAGAFAALVVAENPSPTPATEDPIELVVGTLVLRQDADANVPRQSRTRARKTATGTGRLNSRVDSVYSADTHHAGTRTVRSSLNFHNGDDRSAS